MADNGHVRVPNHVIDMLRQDPIKLSAVVLLLRTRNYKTGALTMSILGVANEFSKSRNWARSVIQIAMDTIGTPPGTSEKPGNRGSTAYHGHPNGHLLDTIKEEEVNKITTTTPPIPPPSGGISYSQDFLDFWKRYPKKTGKGAAWRAWKRHRPPLSAIIETLAWQMVSDKWRQGFIPNPATYLNGRCWEDEQPEVLESQVQVYDAIWGEKK